MMAWKNNYVRSFLKMIHLFFIASLSWYVGVPTIWMRQEPSHTSELESQAYFSEEVTILEEHADWVNVETTIDGCKGWIQKSALHQTDLSPDLTIKINRCTAHLYREPDITHEPILTLPFESNLTVIEQLPDNHWIKVLLVTGQEAFVQRGDVTFTQNLLDRDQMCMFSLNFIGLPYTWGGRSSFGYDCSSFVQMLYRQMGIYIPRNSKMQALWEGFINVPFDALIPGDLIFFAEMENQICHVGAYLGNNQFIHSTIAENAPYIHISSLSDPRWNGSEAAFPFRVAMRLKEMKSQTSSDLVNLQSVIPTIQIDLKYATEDNFTHQVLYQSKECFALKEVALRLRDVQAELATQGLGLKIWDAFRPMSVQQKAWDLIHDERYVSDPKKGGRHTRGTAVDLTLVDQDGKELLMPSAFDELNEKAHRDYRDAPEEAIQNRELLQNIMEKHGFIGFPTEWWHFDLIGWENYPPL